MKKYATVQVEVTRECADCDYQCDYQGVVILKYGMADVWHCPTHGNTFEMTDPIHRRGDILK